MALAQISQDISLEANLRRISLLTKNWPGRPLDPAGSLRILNESGTKPPLFWCFNAAAEFPELARALGPDQPVIGMRSLNQVIDPKKISERVIDELSGYYASHLHKIFGANSCIVGGNCQAASISHSIAVNLLAQKTNVLHIITLDALLRKPYPGEVRMLFGKDSETHNPFFDRSVDPNSSPMLSWRHAFGVANPIIIDGAHGTYFSPENIDRLAQEIARPSVDQRHIAPLDRVPNWRVKKISNTNVTVVAPAEKYDDDLVLVPLWEMDGADYRIPAEDWVCPVVRGRNWSCRIPKPNTPGIWSLKLVLCQLDLGPLAWPLDQHPTLRVEISGKPLGLAQSLQTPLIWSQRLINRLAAR
jgi:thioesterase domain-containing protein